MQHSGYGAGSGDTEYYEYECPCGKGKVIEEHDNIPGFRLEKDEIVDLIEHQKTFSNIVSSKNGMKGDVPNEFIQPTKFKRYICQSIKDFQFRNKHFPSGQYFCVIHENADMALCYTATKTFVDIQKSDIKTV